MYKINILNSISLLFCTTLISCSFQKEIPAKMQMKHNVTMETKLKCGRDWTKTKIYDGIGKKYKSVDEIFSEPMSQILYDPKYVKKSIEKYCN